MDILYNYIIQAILGGASGYITNDYAINMLFKEYTPLKIGGVIKKTRNEFIDNLSSLVENDIINKDKLNDILTDEAFKTKFELLTEDFFSNCLYEIVGTDTFSNINDIDSSAKSTGDFLENILDKHIVEITNLLFNDLEIEDFLTPVQLNKISKSLYESVDNMVNTSDIIKNLLLSAYSEYGNTPIVDLLNGTENRVFNLTENIISKFNQIIRDDFSSEINNAIKDISATAEFNKTLTSAKNILYEKHIKEIFVIDDDLKSKIVKLFIDYINSNKGQNMVCELCTSLFSYVKKCDNTLFDIIDTSFEINLKSYLVENLPNATEKIVDWVMINSKNIDNIIEESIDEVIKESDGIRGKLLSTIRNSYLSNLSEKYGIIQKIVDYVQNESKPEKLSNNISSKVIEYLGNVSIGDMLTEAETNKFLTPLTLSRYLTEYLNNYFEFIFNKFFNYIMNLKINDLLPAEMDSGNIIKEKLLDVIIDKVLSSKTINKTLNKKASSYANEILNKNLNILINEENFKVYITNISDFVANVLEVNSSNIKNLLEKEIKNNISIQKIKTSDGYSNILGGISSEIYKRYSNTTNSIKDKKLTLAIDRMNSIDNLYKNSSETIRTLMINNLDTILGGSVKSIVTENLNKLNDDELSNLANDFIGRELRPIMYFGGVLGTGAGLLLATFQNGPLNLQTINIANMLTYSLVGFSTNAIAINMIFKPYKEIKFLSKIPFLRHFSLGYIVKNKKIFAENMSVFIDRNLLSKESINELFDKYDGNFKNKLAIGISSNDYSILHKFLTNNHESIIEGSYNFTNNLIENNIHNLSNFFMKEVSDFKLSTLLSPININYLSCLGKENLSNTNEKFKLFVVSKISSPEPLENQIPDCLINSMKNSINSFIEKHYDITSGNLGNLNYVKSFMMKYDDKYKNITNRPIYDIFRTIEIKSFTPYISHSLTEMISSEKSRKKATDTITNLFNKSLGGNKTFEDLFNGKIKEYVNENIPSLFDKISKVIKNNIINTSPAISNNIQKEIKKNLGFLQKSMYSLMGGDEIANELISKIMVDKVPAFIDDKKHELLYIFRNIIDEKFYKMKADTLQKSLNKIQIDDMVNTYFSNSENTDLIEKKINLSLVSLENKIEKIDLNDILKLLSLQDINSIFSAYEAEINFLILSLSNNMANNKDEVISIIETLLSKIVDQFMKSASFKDLCCEISDEDINIITNNLIDILNNDDFLNKSFKKFLNSYREFIIGKDNLSFFIDKEELIKSIRIFIKNLISSNEARLALKNIYSSILDEAMDINFNFISEDTKAYIVDVFIESCIKSIRRNLDTILKAIEFDRIAREEIDAMEPRKIHEMFNSFGGKYFRKLMLYGFGGFIFGINTYVGLTLAGLKIISKKFNK